MLVKPFSAGVSRERPQSRISPGGTSGLYRYLNSLHGNTRIGDNESASLPGTDRSLTTPILHRPHFKYIARRFADVERRNLVERFQIARALYSLSAIANESTISLLINLW